MDGRLTATVIAYRRPGTHAGWRWVLVPVAALLVSLIGSAACYWQTSVTLGLFLGPLLLSTLFTPPLILCENQWRARVSVLCALLLGPITVWLLVANTVSLYHTLLCGLVLAGWLSVVSGCSLLLRELHLVPVLASTVTVAVSLIWLTWPVWLSPVLVAHPRGGMAGLDACWNRHEFGCPSIRLLGFAHGRVGLHLPIPDSSEPGRCLPTFTIHLALFAPAWLDWSGTSIRQLPYCQIEESLRCQWRRNTIVALLFAVMWIFRST